MKSKLCGTKQIGTLMNKSRQAWKTNTSHQEENKQSQKMAPDEQINSGGPTHAHASTEAEKIGRNPDAQAMKGSPKIV